MSVCNTQSAKSITGIWEDKSFQPIIGVATQSKYYLFNQNDGMAAPTKEIRVLELYSGIGGMHYALNESQVSVETKVAAAVDINDIGNKIYCHNFPRTQLLQRDITSFSVKELNKIRIDMILMSPPCQPFTRVGNYKDNLDPRTKSLLRLLDTIPRLDTPPEYILLENVKGFDTSQTRQCVLSMLRNHGYCVREFLLTPLQFGLPNSRLRYYLLARRTPFLLSNSSDDEISDKIPPEFLHKTVSECASGPSASLLCKMCSAGLQYETSPCNRTSSLQEPVNCPTECEPLANFLEKKDEEYFHTFLLSDKDLKLYGCMDIVTHSSRKCCCFTKRYSHYMDGAGSIVQMNTEAEVSWKSEPDESCVSELRTLKLRYFTPREIANLLCFPLQFDFPPDISMKQKYRVLGNSLSVGVVAMLIRLLVHG